MKNILSANNLRTGAAWICLLVGIVLYFIGFNWDGKPIWGQFILKAADVLVIGVILGFLTNAARFIGIFKQDLQDIIYGKEYIKQRKDIYPLWENLSKEMFKNKFPRIHKELLKTINGYFPKDDVSYYNDYYLHYIIEWKDKEKGIIKVTTQASFELITDSEKKIIYPLKTWTTISDESEYSYEIINITVNKRDIKKELSSKAKTKESDGTISEEYDLELSGENKYEIKYKSEKTYDLDDDNYIGFKARYIVTSLRVCLDLPEDLNAIFISRGTQNDFDEDWSVKSRKEHKYKGIVLPRQGFIFTLIRLNTQLIS